MTVRKTKNSKKTPDKTNETPEHGTFKKDDKHFTIVGLCASAGGLSAIEGFLRHVKPGCNMAFVIIQHRATESKNVMLELLKKYTPLDVLEIEDGMAVKPESVYINPPHQNVTIDHGKLYCEELTETYGARLSIDFFLRSLAQDQGERSICIILSGTGSDGTLGLKAVKAAGGMAIAQAEKQAQYPSMPSNAIDTGMVDYILPVEEMPDELARYVKHPYLEKTKQALTGEDKLENALHHIFTMVRNLTGHDFSSYKRNTIRRRIERRMAIHQINKIEVYVRFLRDNKDEVETLFRDLIITVTNFFRDGEAFEALKEKCAKDIVRRKPINSSIRIWIPGCATGEEAYSVAIVFDEVMEELGKRCDLYLFATDLNHETIERARSGEYTDSIAADVSPQRLKTYFNKQGSTYKIKDRIREMLVFAKQDLIKDPPFSKLDLICCRNVLIYMGPDLQKKIIPLFHYTLNPDGYLFLGTSESVGQFSDLFSSVDPKCKLFRQKPQAPRHREYPLIALSPQTAPYPPAVQRQEKAVRKINQLAEKVILREYSPPCVIINERFDVVFFNGDTSRFLTQPGGEPTLNLLKLIRRELHYTFSLALHKAEREQTDVTHEHLQVKTDSGILPFDLIIRPIRDTDLEERLWMVIFQVHSKRETAHSKGDDTTESGRSPQTAQPRIRKLQEELTTTKEHLQTTIEELETSNEELKSSNEELQSTNEELQSTNEELETSREELQSTNEELRTVNSEYQGKIEELAQANDDLKNLLASTNIATIFLDTDLNIKRFTPESKKLFKFIDTDPGRPLDNIVNLLDYSEFEKDIRKVLDTLAAIEHEVRTKDNRWLRVKIAPYRTTDNMIDGVVITAFDIGREKQAQLYAESIVETIREPLLILDTDLKVLSANRSFYRTFQVKPDKTEGKRIYDIGNRQWDIPQLRDLLEDIMTHDSEFSDFRVEHEFPTIGERIMLLNARRVQIYGQQTERILLAMEDVSRPQ